LLRREEPLLRKKGATVGPRGKRGKIVYQWANKPGVDLKKLKKRKKPEKETQFPTKVPPSDRLQKAVG